MDIVLGVSMTPSAVRMVLVEGVNADGPSLDHDAFDIPVGAAAATSAAPQQVIDAILGTQESALEGGHRLTSIGVTWTDHTAAGTLRGLLRSHRLDDVVLVSELHAASALAQAIGQSVGYQRTALLFVERDTATLAVVRAADGAVVRVTSRNLQALDVAAELQAMVTGLDGGPEPAQAVYVVGSGVDVSALESDIASATGLPVHAPQDGDLALARGAALASASAPRYEASTVGLASTEDTAAGATQMAAASYMAPLGYSAVSDDDEDLPAYDGAYEDSYGADPQPQAVADEPRKSFVLVGSALSSVFVVGVAALAVTLAVVIRPTADQRPTPGGSPVVSSTPAAVPAQAKDIAPPPAPETIQAPIPVVQEAPRTVVVAPQAPPPAPAPAAPEPAPAAPPRAPEPAPAPPPPPPPPPAPAPAPAPSPAAPAPVPPPAPVIVPVPIVIPPIFQPPVLVPPVVRTPTYPTLPSLPTYTTAPPARTPYQTSTPPVTTYPTYTATPTTVAPTTVAPTTVAPSAGSSSSGSGGSGSGGSVSSGSDSGSSSSSGSSGNGSSGNGSSGSDSGSSKRSQNPLWPLWPFGG